MKLSILGVLALASVVIASAAATGCDGDDHDHSHGTSGGHTSPFPDCNAITQACHEVDVGEGEIHDCHDKAHAAKSEADCTPMKEHCLAICAAAKNDAGGGDGSSSGNGGEDSGTGNGGEDSGTGDDSDAGDSGAG